MNAIQIRHTGGPQVLALADVAQAQPAPGEVLVVRLPSVSASLAS